MEWYSFFVEEVRRSYGAERVELFSRTGVIAKALGPKLSEDQLLPYMLTWVDSNDDEILYRLIGELISLGKYIDTFGTYRTITESFLKLMPTEEVIVRDTAVDGIGSICEEIEKGIGEPHANGARWDANDLTMLLEGTVIPAISTNGKGEWFSSRRSAVRAIPKVWRYASPKGKEQIIQLFSKLCKDETPMIKRACGEAMADLVPLLSKDYIIKNILADFNALATLTMASETTLRASLLNAAKAMLPRLTIEERESYLLTFLMSTHEDRYWQTRIAFVMRLKEIIPHFQSTIVCQYFLPAMQSLLADREGEVRSAMLKELCDIVEVLNIDQIGSLLPILVRLSSDESQVGKSELAKTFRAIVAKTHDEVTCTKLATPVLELLRNNDYLVRIEAIDTIAHLVSVYNEEAFIGPLVNELYRSQEDPQWRVRHALVKQIPSLLNNIGQASVHMKMFPPLMLTLAFDGVAEVREAADNVTVEIAKDDPPIWFTRDFLPIFIDKWDEITPMHEEPRATTYLERIAIVRTICKLWVNASDDLISTLLASTLHKGLSDPVINVRLITLGLVAKMIINSALTFEQYSPTIEELVKKNQNHADMDVRLEAFRALAAADEKWKDKRSAPDEM